MSDSEIAGSVLGVTVEVPGAENVTLNATYRDSQYRVKCDSVVEKVGVIAILDRCGVGIGETDLNKDQIRLSSNSSWQSCDVACND